jgi:hypothetical protein
MKATLKLLMCGALLWSGGVLAARAAEPDALATCAKMLPFPNGIAVVTAIRVYTAPDGESAFEDLPIKSESKAFFKPGELFTHVDLGGAKKVQLVSGPPNVTIAFKPTPYKEMFLALQGESTIVLPNGQERKLSPGSLLIMDDQHSKTGHGGRTGPCGYLDLNIVPPDPAP